MPGYDGTGPMGRGAMTGRGMGPCNGYGPGRGAGFGFGRGFGRRRGFGMGFRQWGYDEPYAPNAEPVELNKDQQKKVLEAGIAELEAELKSLKDKLKEIK